MLLNGSQIMNSDLIERVAGALAGAMAVAMALAVVITHGDGN